MRNMQGALAQETMRRINNLGMSPRQQMLNRLWSYYMTAQYDHCGLDWDGTAHSGMVEKTLISTGSFIPPGHYDAANQMGEVPLKYRRPRAPYHLGRVIVNRFTGLLFSKSRHPTFAVADDKDTEEFVRGIAEAGRLWPSMILARTYGGAMGSVAVGFKFVRGKPEIEVHDPRWLRPTFRDRNSASLELASLEKRYMYFVEMFDGEKGEWVQVPFWYRRFIDDKIDALWPRVPVGDGTEPDWDGYLTEQNVVQHDFGFVPAQWIQNVPIQDDIDGEPDCAGIYDTIEEIDALQSQAGHGTIANCDPTLLLITDQELGEIKKGSDNAIKLPIGSSGNYLEISAAGIAAARDLAKDLRAQALEVAQVVLEHPDVAGGRTATEVERMYSSMFEKADVLREQYGERGLKPLMEKMLEGIRKLDGGTVVDGQRQRSQVFIPPLVKDGKLQDRQLGKGKLVEAQWPPYVSSSVEDAAKATTAASTAKAAGLIGTEDATKYTAPHFGIDDPAATVAAIRKEAKEEQQFLTSSLMGGMGGMGADQPELQPDQGDDEMIPIGAMEAGLFTMNEYRKSRGFPAMTDGELTLPEYRAKYPEKFLTTAALKEGNAKDVIAAMGDARPKPPKVPGK
jgi:hypothetical protein